MLEILMQTTSQMKVSYPGDWHFMLVLRSDGNPEIEQQWLAFRMHVTTTSIPVFDELTNVSRLEHFLFSINPTTTFQKAKTCHLN